MQAQNKLKSVRERFSFECAEQQVSASCVEREEQSGACTEQAQGGASERKRRETAHGRAYERDFRARAELQRRAQAQNEHKAVQRRDINFRASTKRSKRVQAQNKRKSVRERCSLECAEQQVSACVEREEQHAQSKCKAVQRRDINFRESTKRSKRVQAQNKRKSVRERCSLECAEQQVSA